MSEPDTVELLLNLIERCREVSPKMTSQQLVSLLLVAKEEGLTVSDYTKQAGMTQGVMTRTLLDLGGLNTRRKPGLMLVEQRPDLNDKRAHRTYLTPKGRSFVADLRSALERTHRRSAAA